MHPLFVLTFALFAAQPGSQDAILHLDEALAIAQANNPMAQGAEADAVAATAQARISRASLFPQLTGQASYLRSTSNFAGSPGTVPRGILPPSSRGNLRDSTNYYNFGLTLTQLVYDFGGAYHTLTASLSAADAKRSTAEDVRSQVAAQVRTSYFAAQAMRANVHVAQENLANQNRHKDQIAGQVKVGSRPEIDLLQAKTDTSNARVQLIAANANYRLSRAQLNNVMGRETSLNYEVADEAMPALDAEAWPFAQALEEALASRPDWRAALAQVAAQRAQVRAARAGYLPSLGVTASLTDAGARIDEMAANWRAGASLSWPLFGGGQTLYTARAAEANRQSLAANASQIRQAVRLAVCQARLTVESALEQVGAAADALANAQSLLRQAEARYQAGVSGVIELGDAQLAATQAAAQQVAATYSLASARATLMRALGRS